MADVENDGDRGPERLRRRFKFTAILPGGRRQDVEYWDASAEAARVEVRAFVQRQCPGAVLVGDPTPEAR